MHFAETGNTRIRGRCSLVIDIDWLHRIMSTILGKERIRRLRNEILGRAKRE